VLVGQAGGDRDGADYAVTSLAAVTCGGPAAVMESKVLCHA
jgi:hypothetical protein